MENYIVELMNETVLDSAAKRFGTSFHELTLIGEFQNFVYEFEKDGAQYILRITHSDHRERNMIEGELEWLAFLTQNGVNVAKPYPSINGNFTEKIVMEDSYFIVTSFRKIKGEKLAYPQYLSNEKIFEKLGETTGRIHAVSKEYAPSSDGIKRHGWSDNYYLNRISEFVPSDQSDIFESYRYLMDRISQLEKDRDSFGLIHGDINVGNFMVEDGEIAIFDFDECQYSWFVEDIAVQLFYTIYIFLEDSIEHRDTQAELFMKNFMKGYLRENSIDDYWIEKIPMFLQLREIIVYIGMYRSIDFDNMRQWTKDYLKQSRDRIEKRIPLINEIKWK